MTDEMMKVHLAALFLLLPVFFIQLVPPANTGYIQGRVLRGDTGEPIAGAVLTLQRVMTAAESIAAGPVPSRDSNSPIRSDARGEFVFKDVATGRYRLLAISPQYSRQEYRGTLDVIAGKPITDVIFRLTPTGAVTGRVISVDGDPLEGMEVLVARPVYDENGQKNLQAASSTRTDDRGIYRLFSIPSGRYYLIVRSPMTPDPANLRAGIDTSDSRAKYVGIYYPRATDARDASTIEIKPGEELPGLDFILFHQGTYRIRGQLIDGTTGRPPGRGTVLLGIIPRQPVALTGFGGSALPYKQDGTFELTNVPPGEYWVTARIPVPMSLVKPGEPLPPVPVARAPVDINYRDVDNIVLTFAPFVSVKGRLSVDGQPPSTLPGLDSIRIALVPPRAGTANIGGIPGIHTPIQPDGTFTYPSLIPDVYRVTIGGLPPDAFVKQARHGNVDVLNNSMKISGSDSDPINVLISLKGGRIDGRVVDERGKPVANITAVLVPDKLRHRTDLYKTATTEANGHFTIRGITPGEYSVVAQAKLEPYAYFDPDFLKQFEKQSELVRISESSKAVVNVKAIVR